MLSVPPVVDAAGRPKSAAAEVVKPPAAYETATLRPSAAVRLMPEPVSLATTPVAAD